MTITIEQTQVPLRVDETGTIKPDLARKWDLSPDGLIYTFTLRSDVQWSDGAPFSADDGAFLGRICTLVSRAVTARPDNP